MCNVCVIESVKQLMISCCSLFVGVVVMGVVVIVVSILVVCFVLVQVSGKVVDLIYVFDEIFFIFDGVFGIVYEEVVNFDVLGYQFWKIMFFEYLGMYIDVLLYFLKDGLLVVELVLESLICLFCVIDIIVKVCDDVNVVLEVEDVEVFILVYGEIFKGVCVVMNFGWGVKVVMLEFCNMLDGKFVFLGFGKLVIDFLVQMGVVVIVSDMLLLDFGSLVDFVVYNLWLFLGYYGIENLVNVDQLFVIGVMIFVGVLKYVCGIGGLVCVMVVV